MQFRALHIFVLQFVSISKKGLKLEKERLKIIAFFELFLKIVEFTSEGQQHQQVETQQQKQLQKEQIQEQIQQQIQEQVIPLKYLDLKHYALYITDSILHSAGGYIFFNSSMLEKITVFFFLFYAVIVISQKIL